MPDLTLNIAQTAALCGVSVRQLGYWTKQGYVTATGRGARRLYGPEALRRILAIRQGMHDGLSLRQSLRALDAAQGEHSYQASASHSQPPPDGTHVGSAALSRSASESVTADLLSLFEGNRATRDSAVGLSAKLGRTVEDVRAVAEQLALRGVLTKNYAADEVIYTRLGGTLA